ncbi:MAG: hypothetical protein COA50_12680 [Flavobacteriaceae bacterium]|nr:MAG: hypothetical protein COA50_12680 [Flavobacteriaceae bacterium]
MKSLGYLLIVLFLVSCSSVRVNYDYDKTTDFTNYSTYNYYPDINSGLNELDGRRLIRAVDSIMTSKGLLLSEEPDFYINIFSDAYVKPNNSSIGIGVGGTGRNIGGGVSMGVPIGGSQLLRQIQFDFIDSQKDMLFWNASVKSGFRDNGSPNEKEKIIRQLVAKAFAKYPPKKRK